VEQFVGLMLDKSKGLVLGSELVANGNFSGNSSAGWILDTGWAVVNDTLTFSGASARNATYFDAAIVNGKTFKVEFDVLNCSNFGATFIALGGTSYLTFSTIGITTTGRKSLIIAASGASAWFLLRVGAGVTAAFDNISVRELPGNHATSTGTKRPKLAARYNLLTYTEQFDNGAWAKLGATVTPNVVTAPNGALTADKFFSTAGAATIALQQASTLVSGTQYIRRIFAKAAEISTLTMQVGGTTLGTVSVQINLTNGTATNGGIVTALPDGWFEITYTYTQSGTTADFYFVLPGGTTTGRGVYLWGADLRPASQATGLIGPTYQRVVDAATYDTVGFLPYLQFDGIDDSMSTGSIDFTATDKMTVWAGVRKLSDAAAGMLAELSANINSNNGAFYLTAPNDTGASGNYAFASKGTLFSGSTVSLSGTVLAPNTSVLTGIGDISGDNVLLRRNGVNATAGTGDQGTGNFGNYPLYIGQRGGSSLPFNGWLTSLIVRGAQSTQSQIEATESWVNGKTGAY
jgi:hypothetical protein